MKTIRVKNIWLNDSGDVSIILLAPIDTTRTLRNDLFWYSGDECPDWQRGQELSDKEVLATHCYKQIKMQSVEDDIPDDCYMAL